MTHQQDLTRERRVVIKNVDEDALQRYIKYNAPTVIDDLGMSVVSLYSEHQNMFPNRCFELPVTIDVKMYAHTNDLGDVIIGYKLDNVTQDVTSRINLQDAQLAYRQTWDYRIRLFFSNLRKRLWL